MGRSWVFCIKYSVLSILLLLASFMIHTSTAYAQTLDYSSYCTAIAGDPPPQDSPDRQYREPTWEELDKTGDFKTTVTDTFQMIDVPGPAGRGGRLSSQSLLLPNAKEVADYLEGAYLDEGHRLKDLRTLKSADFQSYFGTVVKLTPQKIQDRLKRQYVHSLAVWGRRPDGSYKTPDINLTYADYCGQNPRTISDLLQAYQFPTPPTSINNPTPADYERWFHTWAKYWPKIPLHAPGGAISCDPYSFFPGLYDDSQTASCQAKFPEGVFDQPPNMLSQGCLVFRRLAEFGNPPTQDCPPPAPPNLLVVKLGVPDLLRLDTLARFTQQLLLPQKLMKLYFCKFRAGDGRPEDFCQAGEQVTQVDCKEPVGVIQINRLGTCAPPKGEQGVGGTPIKIYDPEISILGGGETVETIKIESRFPYLGLTFGKLTSALVGTFKFFDPQGIWLGQEKYQQNSTKIPYTWNFVDTTIPVAGGHITEPPVWAGFLSGIKKSKNFVICSLLPSKQDAAACANENLNYNPVSR